MFLYSAHAFGIILHMKLSICYSLTKYSQIKRFYSGAYETVYACEAPICFTVCILGFRMARKYTDPGTYILHWPLYVHAKLYIATILNSSDVIV